MGSTIGRRGQRGRARSGWAAPAGAALDEEALAAQWAESLAQDEEDKGPASFGSAGAGLGGHAVDAQFQDMTEMARQPKDNKLKRELDFILDIPLDVSAELWPHAPAHQRAAATGPGLGG